MGSQIRRTAWLLLLCTRLPAGDAQREEMEAVLTARLAEQVEAELEPTKRRDRYAS